MKRIVLITSLTAITLVGILVVSRVLSTSPNLPVTILETTVPPIPTLNPETVESGKQIYNQYCSGCHGGELEGQPNWKISLPDGSLPPPPHDSSGHTWHHTDPVLIEIIANGGDPNLFNTKMPGFDEQLSEKDIMAVLDYIKTYWGTEEREYQWWLTAREN